MEAYTNLDYIHDEIRGSPTLPPPKRPSEREGFDESPAVSWIERRFQKSPPSVL
jgi:hypothetical protein